MALSPPGAPHQAAPASRAPVAVIDIGSNSVRLVAYDGLTRAPAPVFNERALCGLGRGLADTGKLDVEGVAMAERAIARFAGIALSLDAEIVDVVATAAVRDAENGRAFVERVERTCGLKVRVLSGEEEARTSALGVLAGTPGADGLMGDLGGGSLEIVELAKGGPGRAATFPLGSLRLKKANDDDQREAIEKTLRAAAWLDDRPNRTFYAVGGSWRALARLHIAQNEYPLRIIHNYVMSRDAAESLTRVVARMGPASLERIRDVPRRRVETLPVTALTLQCLLKVAKPKEVVFSAYGVREGLLYNRLSEAQRREDPLLAACRALAQRDNRGADADLLHEWLSPAFAKENPEESRLRHAACIVRDIAWRAHPDYRAEYAFRNIIYAPFVGIDHPGRVFLSLAVHARYEGRLETDVAEPYRALIDEDAVRRARTVGLAIRLANNITANARYLVGAAKLELSGDRLVLRLNGKGRKLLGDPVHRRLAALAKALGKRPHILDFK